jgi:hypothetical protein
MTDEIQPTRSTSETSPVQVEQTKKTLREKTATAGKWLFGILVGRIISKLLDVVF